MNRSDFQFPDKDVVYRSYTHDLKELVSVAGLKAELETALQADAQLSANWNIVKDWSERSRYEFRSRQEARNLYRAVTGRSHGVLSWVRQHW